MHRLIMTSDAYKMASQFADADDLAKDPENSYLWRFRIQRLDAEIVRDSILAVSGTLNREMFGPPVFPKLQSEDPGIDEIRHLAARRGWSQGVAAQRVRLSQARPAVPDVRGVRPAGPEPSCGARNVSTVPTQALTLMNDDWVLKQAKLFANRVQRAAKTDPAREVELAYRSGAEPPAANRKSGRRPRRSCAKHKLVDLTHVLLNLNEFLYMR